MQKESDCDLWCFHLFRTTASPGAVQDSNARQKSDPRRRIPTLVTCLKQGNQDLGPLEVQTWELPWEER